MSNLVYLLLAVTFSLLGSLAVWYRHRQPRSLEYGIDEFQRELQALAPEHSSSGTPPPPPPSPRPPDERGP
ncbi:MAG TPA: hypothetical protein VMZ51_04550 [Acidimicrobiales bacterium]|nr:hypothetical protein [Acidimicrobiales bacterium]